ncbi:MAG: RHS repeat-associated core domain-containing protein [Pseudomonadota bacterium]
MTGILLSCCCAALPGTAMADCGPVPGGPPAACAPSSPASVGASGGADAGAGNPINVITGNKYQREEDMPALPGVLGLEIVRHYNSAYSKPGSPNGPMGREWKLSYETELFEKFGKIQILQADGARVIFDRDPKNPGLCSTALPANGRITLARQPNGMTNYTWTWPNGRRLHFNRWGKLDSITAPTGEAVSLQYDPGQVLVRVTDPQGRSLHLGYLDREAARAGNRFRGVQTIDSPVGRFSYEYGGAAPQGAVPFDARILLANMIRVRLPGGRDAATSSVSRAYHHEDPRFPWLLTGISIETAGADGKPIVRRYATFGYDDNGLANLSTHAGNVGKVMLDTREGGKTVLTNSLGQRTVYRHAIVGGEHRMLEVRGAGCSTCGETNVRYVYDKLGQLVEAIKLNVNGVAVSAIRRKLDKLGRPVTISKVDYQDGKPGAATPQLRLEYLGDGAAPTLLAGPSVVPGRERQMRIAYNLAGQPLSVTETGWIPTYDGKQAAAQIARTTTYQYASINGHSLLTRIDGPLPNGKTNSPLDSDVTVFEYDNRPDSGSEQGAAAEAGNLARYDERAGRRDGLLTRIIAPGNLVTKVLARDEALRPAKLRIMDGDLVRFFSIRSNWRGQPEDIEQTGGALRRHLHFDYDADGRIQTVTRPGNLRSTFEYDPAGRPSRIILPDGSGIALAHDTEDRTARVERYDDMARLSAPALSSTRLDYGRDVDKPSQLLGMTDSLGLLTSYRYNDIGQVVAIANAIGTSAAFEYDAEGRIARRTDAAGSTDSASLSLAYDHSGHATQITASNGVNTLRRYDDFGLKVFEADPDRGVALFRYDAAGRLIVRIDETNSATRYTYDNAGRLLAVGKDKLTNLLQYRYRGGRLASMVSTTDGDPAHATERLEYQYDAMGQMTKETRWLADVAARDGAGNSFASKGLLFVTRNEYDEAGRLVRQILPDGHSLHYRFAPGSDNTRQVEARHRPGQLEAILFDDQIVVGDIEQSIAGGLTGYTMSNGARQQIQLDRRGRIEQLRTLSNDTAAHAPWWRQVAAWFSFKDRGTAPLYRQINRYDDAGRLVQIERQLGALKGGEAAKTRREEYAYDRMNRLTGIIPSEGVGTTFRYDRAGNRVAETSVPARADRNSAAAGPTEHRFNYAPGGNWLLAATQVNVDGAAAPAVQNAWFYHPTGLPLAQLHWQADGATNRRTVYNSDRRPVAVYDNGQLIVRYHYNSQGERIAKSVYSPRPALVPLSFSSAAAQSETTYSLFSDERLIAETDSHGHIIAHYIYLYGKPVAKIEIRDNTILTHRLLKAIRMGTGDNASDSLAQIFAIVTDHLGTPQEVLDAQLQLVWQAASAAFGQARVVYAAAAEDGKPFQMNLRLPGQVYDAESGLHYNYLRDYDPILGRYLTPDPMGLSAGTNPFAYGSNNPLTNVDPLGLYQIDVHYYMTFFLAITAGVDKCQQRL